MLKPRTVSVWCVVFAAVAALTAVVLHEELPFLRSLNPRAPPAWHGKPPVAPPAHPAAADPVAAEPPHHPDAHPTGPARARGDAAGGLSAHGDGARNDDEGAEAGATRAAGQHESHDDGDEGLRADDVDDDEHVLPSRRPCFIYDKPPRTGSTTIGVALKRCLLKRGFKQPRPFEGREQRSETVGKMLGLAARRVGTMSHHVGLDGADVARLRRECGRIAYVTSCKPMRARLWSAAKFHFSDGIGNSSLTEADKERAVQLVEHDARTERFLEAYPYLNEEEKENETPLGQRFHADYVVRADNMDEDLARLLTVLGCEGEFQSRNVHELELDLGFLDKIRLEQGDATYRRLRKQADTENEEGLKRIAEFYKYAMQERFEDEKR